MSMLFNKSINRQSIHHNTLFFFDFLVLLELFFLNFQAMQQTYLYFILIHFYLFFSGRQKLYILFSLDFVAFTSTHFFIIVFLGGSFNPKIFQDSH